MAHEGAGGALGMVVLTLPEAIAIPSSAGHLSVLRCYPCHCFRGFPCRVAGVEGFPADRLGPVPDSSKSSRADLDVQHLHWRDTAVTAKRTLEFLVKGRRQHCHYCRWISFVSIGSALD